jgi:hypothetical protein
MPAKKLREFLSSQNVTCMTISHTVAYTAKEIAFNAGSHDEIAASRVHRLRTAGEADSLEVF